MNKPKPKTRTVLDWSECTSFIEDKYKIQTRDYARSHQVFPEWLKATCEKAANSYKDIKGSQEQWKRYQAAIVSGKVIDLPYQDFWHWLIDVTDVQRGGTIELDVQMGNGAEPWHKEILALYLKEFGKGPYLTDW